MVKTFSVNFENNNFQVGEKDIGLFWDTKGKKAST
jgi:hypothetical protein